MFTFVTSDDSIGLDLNSPNMSMCFVATEPLPESVTTASLIATQGAIVFSTRNTGVVRMSWNATRVILSVGCEQGLITAKIVKTDNSLETALLQWLHFQHNNTVEKSETNKNI